MRGLVKSLTPHPAIPVPPNAASPPRHSRCAKAARVQHRERPVGLPGPFPAGKPGTWLILFGFLALYLFIIIIYLLPYYLNVLGPVCVGMAWKIIPKVALCLRLGMGWRPNIAFSAGWDE